MAPASPRSRPRSHKLYSREVEVLTAGPRAVLSDPASSPAAVGLAEAQLERVDRKVRSDGLWRFFMVGLDDGERVFNWMADHSKRLRLWNRIWAVLPRHVDKSTGEIKLTRDQLASLTGHSPRDVSLVMSELEECRAIIRHRERVPGLRGPGVVRYFLNSSFGTREEGAARDKLQARDRGRIAERAGPILRVIDGSARPPERRSRAPLVPSPVL